MDRRQFLTSLAVAASGKQLVLTEGQLDATVTRVEPKTKPAQIVTLHFNDLPVLLGGEDALMQVTTPLYTCPVTKRKYPTRYTTVTFSRAVGPKAVWDRVFREFSNVLDAPKNTLVVKLGDRTLVTLDNAILTQIGVQYEAQEMLVLDGTEGFGALSLIGTWREQKAAYDEYFAAEQRYVEAQRKELEAKGLPSDGPLNEPRVLVADGDSLTTNSLDTHWCEDCTDFHG
jgi:hypothetical protein